MRLGTLLVMAAAVGVAGYTGYQTFHEPKAGPASVKPQGPIPVEAVAVRAGELTVSLSTVGSLKANESLILKPEIAGRIDVIHLEEGRSAKKGDLLISIDDRVYAAELKQAEATLNLMRVNYGRAKLLKEKGAGTVSNYDTMSANLNVSQAQVELARATLDKTRIVAPFDGVMGLRKVSPGDYVNPGQDIATFQSKNPIKAEFTVPETALRAVSVGQTIDIQVDAIPGRSFPGTIYAIDPQIDEASRNITLRAMIPNDGNILQPGLFARVTIAIAHKPRALFIPEAAIIPRGNDSFVMKVGADKKVATVPVTIGERKNGEVEITSGLAEGDIVITGGQQKLRDGQEAGYTLANAAGENK